VREKCRLDDVRNEEVDFVSEDCICCFVAILFSLMLARDE
jgi:hypothetical protein